MNLSYGQAYGLMANAEQVNSRDVVYRQPGGYHQHHKKVDRQVLDLHELGWANWEIAEHLEVHRNTVCKILVRHGQASKIKNGSRK